MGSIVGVKYICADDGTGKRKSVGKRGILFFLLSRGRIIAGLYGLGRLGFTGLRRCHGHSVVGVGQADPAGFDLAPGNTLHHTNVGNGQDIVLVHIADCRIPGAGLRADIQLVGGHGDLDGVKDLLLLTLLPVGIQGHGVHRLVQLGHLGTALGLGKPAQEGIAGPGGFAVELHRQVDIVALDGAADMAAVSVVTDIAVVLRLTPVIGAVQVHIGLDQTPLHQIRDEAAAGIAGQGHGGNELIAHIPFHNCHHHRLIFHLKPCAAFVVCKTQKRVELMLGKGDPLFIQEVVDLDGKAGDLHGEQGVGFLHRNAFLGVALKVFVGTAIAEANRPLAEIPIGHGREAFHLFQIITNIFTWRHGRRSMSLHRSQCSQTKGQHNGQNQAHNSFHHESLLLNNSFAFSIIAVNSRFCNLFFLFSPGSSDFSGNMPKNSSSLWKYVRPFPAGPCRKNFAFGRIL